MRLTGAARLLLQNALWRVTGLAVAGRAVVRTLGSPDDDLRTMAGILLARAGRRAVPLLAEALRRRENLPLVLAVLGDIGDWRLEPELVQLGQDRDPAVAEAARDALRVLEARQRATAAQ